MTAARKINRISVEDYLAGELVSPIKHDYVGGLVYAMAGATNLHNIIKKNTLVAVDLRLRGRRCQPFDSDTKIRIQLPGETRFYYPDLSIVCSQNPVNDSFQDKPVVIFEVLSKKTRRFDEGEKKDAYLTIPSLAAYVLIEPETASVVVWRRKRKHFVQESYDGMKKIVPLGEVEISLPLKEIYAGIHFVAEPD